MLISPSIKTEPLVSHGFISEAHSLLGVTPPPLLQDTAAHLEHVFSTVGIRSRRPVPDRAPRERSASTPSPCTRNSGRSYRAGRSWDGRQPSPTAPRGSPCPRSAWRIRCPPPPPPNRTAG